MHVLCPECKHWTHSEVSRASRGVWGGSAVSMGCFAPAVHFQDKGRCCELIGLSIACSSGV